VCQTLYKVYKKWPSVEKCDRSPLHAISQEVRPLAFTHPLHAAGVIKGIRALGAVAEVEAAIAASQTVAASKQRTESEGLLPPQDAAVFLMMYPAGQASVY